MVIVVAVILVFAAIAVGATGLAGVTGNLPRNRWAGVRTPATLRSDEAFALANRIAGPTMVAAAAALLGAAFAAAAFSGITQLVAIASAIVAALFFAGYGAALGTRAANTVKEQIGGCGETCGGCSLKDACGTA